MSESTASTEPPVTSGSRASQSFPLGASQQQEMNSNRDRSHQNPVGTTQSSAPHLNPSSSPHPNVQNLDFRGFMTANMDWIEPFEGKRGEDAIEWIHTFDWIAESCSWDPGLKIIQFRKLMRGTARNWFDSLGVQVKQSYARVTEEFKKAFKTESIHQFYQQVMELKQGKEEDVEDFLYKMLKICQKTNAEMSDGEKMNHFVRGLLPEIKDSVITKGVRTLDDAVQAAKQKQSAIHTLNTWRDKDSGRELKRVKREDETVRNVNSHPSSSNRLNQEGDSKNYQPYRRSYQSSWNKNQSWKRDYGGKDPKEETEEGNNRISD